MGEYWCRCHDLPTSVDCVERVLIQNHMQGDEFRQLIGAVNNDGQEVNVCRLKSVALDPNSANKKPRLYERDAFPAKILDTPPIGWDVPSNCDIFVEIFPRKVFGDALCADVVLSDLVTSDGKS